MKTNLIEFLNYLNIEATITSTRLIILGIIILTSLLVHFFLHKIVLKYIKKLDSINSNFLTQSFLEFNLFKRLSLLFQGILVYWQALIWISNDNQIFDILQSLSLIWICIFGILSFYSIIDKVFLTLHSTVKSPFFAMKSVIQSIKLLFGLVCFIYIVSVLINKSPVAILSGLGAMSAVLMLVFKDTILGFTAGLQISTNNMVQIGDWIEMPKYGADGDIIDIGLNVVKVRNFDKTITTIPTYALVSDSFKNWQGMKEAGGRRIKRAVLLDINTISFLTNEDMQRLKKANLLAPYLKEKKTEIESYNESNNFDLSVAINGRRLTNIGTLRAYLNTYLKNHPDINQDMTVMVRQLAPNEYGMPLEIYCFTSTTVWSEYESIQADIFDHIYASLEEFNIKPYQYG